VPTRTEAAPTLLHFPPICSVREKGSQIMSVKHWVSGQSGYTVDCGPGIKTRVVFGIFDEKHTSIGWYMFSSNANAATQKVCKTTDVSVYEDFGHHDVPTAAFHIFDNAIGVDQLLDGNKPTPATMLLDTARDKRFIYCSLDNLKTKANGFVHLAFWIDRDSEPPQPNVDIPGKVYFLETGPYDAKKFGVGPQGKAAQGAIWGPVS
jgi:hypothetical protein